MENRYLYSAFARGQRKKQQKEPVRKDQQTKKPIQNVDTHASQSIIEQDKLLTEWVEEYFQEETYEVVDYFVDDGSSGTDDTRYGFRRLITCIEDGTINCFVVKTLSRAFRNYADQGRYLEQVFPRLGVRFISTSNPFVDSYNDFDAINNGMEIPINGLVNDRFAAKTSADIRRTLDAKRRRGEFIGAFAPYGYIKDPEDKNSLLIDEEAAGNVRDIFRWFVMDGLSKRGIALKLNELGVPNPTAYKQQILKLKYQNPGTKMNDGLWSGYNIASILRNQVYIGNMVQGRHRIISYKVHAQVKMPQEDWYVVPNTHTAIIDQELFEQAQLLHTRDTRTAPHQRENYLFSGLLRCSDCKKSMRRKKSKNYVYYHCRTVTDKGQGACINRSIREDRLITAVSDAIGIQIGLAQALDDALEAVQNAPTGKALPNRLKDLLQLRSADLAKVISASDDMYMDWKNGDITKEDYRRMKASFAEKARALKVTIETINNEINRLANDCNADDPYLTSFLRHRNIVELNRGIVVALIHAIYIHQNGRVTIHFNFSDELIGVVGATENHKNDFAPVRDGIAPNPMA